MKIEQIAKPIQIGIKTAPNRIVYQPTESNNCDAEGSPTETTFDKYRRIAEGRPGIIHIESIDVTKRTQARTNRMCIMEENLPALERLVSEIRNINGDSIVLFQLSHAGRLSDPSLKPGYSVYDSGDGVRSMSKEEIRETSREFVDAALRAEQVGADGIDFKQAHGFIGGDFLHPANRRNDEYGGSFENRTRFFRETYHAMRSGLKRGDFIIGSRISPYEGVMGGFGTSEPDGMIEDLTEPREFARLLEAEGLDYINVSAGYANANLELLIPTDQYPEGVFRHFYWTSLIKDAVGIPVIGSGYSNLRDGDNNVRAADPEKKSLLYWAEKNIRESKTDMIGIGRQSIADPNFARKVVEGTIRDIDWCTACSGCGLLLGSQLEVGCTVYQDIENLPVK
ncbi:MAG: NADH:flavin oxidoreductase [Spirochaetales bacterium]|nr:NADH:flavin oxidoreductase [Spirochaetales bacterium]